MNNKIDNNYKRIYFLCGNARTFLNCFDSTYKNIIDKLFCDNTKKNTHVLFYLKCDDPGPKKQKEWDFTYTLLDETILKNIISKFTEKYNNISFHLEILPTNKINDSNILLQVKNRKLYTGFLGNDEKLIRILHIHYNFEDCGKIINKIESHNKFNFDFYIYIRPDLFFEEPCHNISKYITNTDKIILGKGPNNQNTDHMAIIPHKYKYDFFFERMNLFRTNDKKNFCITEEIYLTTIEDKYIIESIGKYSIKRESRDTKRSLLMFLNKSCIILCGRQYKNAVDNIKKIIDILNADLFLVYENDICDYSSHKKIKGKIKVQDYPNESKINNQFLKIKEGWILMREYEKKNNFKYKSIFRLRADINYKLNDSIYLKMQENYVYLNSDFLFYGLRKYVKNCFLL